MGVIIQSTVQAGAPAPPLPSALTLTTTTLPAATVGTAYTALLQASGGTPPYSWTALALPDGLTVAAATGVISGMPTSAATTAVVITVQDASAATASRTLPLAVNAPIVGSGISIMTDSLPQATTGVMYGKTLMATGGTQPYTWAMSAAVPGLSFDHRFGLLLGTPTTAGTTSLTFTVTDGSGDGGTATLPLTVVAGRTDFDYYVSPDGDDTTGTGTLSAPKSLTGIASFPGGSRIGLLPGTYQYSRVNGVATSLYARALGSPVLVNPPMGSESSPTFIGSSDSTGQYSPRTAIISVLDPNVGCSFTGSISGATLTITAVSSGTIVQNCSYLGEIAGTDGIARPCWVGGFISGAQSTAGATYFVYPFNYSYTGAFTSHNAPTDAQPFVTSGNGTLGGSVNTPVTGNIPTNGYVTYAGLVLQQFVHSGIRANAAYGITVYDCEFGPARCQTSAANSGMVRFQFCEGCRVFNNKFKCFVDTTVQTMELTAPASGMWRGGTLTDPWPWPSSIIASLPIAPVMVSGTYVDSGWGNRPGLQITEGQTAVTYNYQFALTTAPASGSTFSGSGTINIAGPGYWPLATSSGYPMVLSTGQEVSVTLTHGSTTFSVDTPVVITGTPTTVVRIVALLITGTPSTQITYSPTGYGPWGQAYGYVQIPGGFKVPNEFHHNTAYHQCLFLTKDYTANTINAYNNYLEWGDWGSQPATSATLNGVSLGNSSQGFLWLQGTDTNNTNNFHHNIMVGSGGIQVRNMMGGVTNWGTVNIMNNTFVNSPNVITPGSLSTSVVNRHNNIMYWTGSMSTTVGSFVLDMPGTASAPLYTKPSETMDYNVFQTGMRFTIGMYPASPMAGTTMQQLSGWQNSPGTTGMPTGWVGYDKNSQSLAASPFAGTPTPVRVPTDINSFALSSSGPAATGGIGGMPCGALDGTVDRIGCDW